MTQPIKNPCFVAIPDIKAICDNYFQDLNLHFFGHITVFPNGKFHFLCSRYDWPEYGYIDNNVPPAGFTIYDKIENSIVLPSMDSGAALGWTDEVAKTSKEQFGIQSPMVIFRKYDDHYQGFCFDLHDERVYEKYINHLDFFETFIFYYKDRARDLLSMASQNQLQVQAKYLQPVKPMFSEENSKLLPSRYFLIHGNKEYSVSPREYECLGLLAHGKKVKEISRLLNISSRTIETYIVSIKQKLFASTLSEAIDVYWKNRFI